MSKGTKFNLRLAEKAALLDVEGPLRGSQSEQSLRNRPQEILDAGHRKIAIHLARVNFLDRSGLRAMVKTFTTVTKARGKCIFFAPSEFVQQTLKMLMLDSALNLYDNEASALASL